MGCQASKDVVVIDCDGVVLKKPDDRVVGSTVVIDTDDECDSSSVITISSTLDIDVPKYDVNRRSLYTSPAIGCRKHSKLRRNREINRRKLEHRERKQRVVANRISWEQRQQKQCGTAVQ